MKNNDLHDLLADVCESLEDCQIDIQQYAALHPELRFLSKLLILVQSVGTELHDKVDDILSELSEIPDSFSEILDNVNLVATSTDGIVTVSLVPCGHEAGHAASFTDTSFIGALLKAYSYVKESALSRPRYCLIKLTSTVAHLGAEYALQLVPVEGLALHLEDRIGFKEEYQVETLKSGFVCNSFTVVSLEDGILRIKWNIPFTGTLTLLGPKV